MNTQLLDPAIDPNRDRTLPRRSDCFAPVRELDVTLRQGKTRLVAPLPVDLYEGDLLLAGTYPVGQPDSIDEPGLCQKEEAIRLGGPFRTDPVPLHRLPRDSVLRGKRDLPEGRPLIFQEAEIPDAGAVQRPQAVFEKRMGRAAFPVGERIKGRSM
jgi:hypothetical protein